jgi:hypothetical protein
VLKIEERPEIRFRSRKSFFTTLLEEINLLFAVYDQLQAG